MSALPPVPAITDIWAPRDGVEFGQILDYIATLSNDSGTYDGTPLTEAMDSLTRRRADGSLPSEGDMLCRALAIARWREGRTFLAIEALRGVVGEMLPVEGLLRKAPDGGSGSSEISTIAVDVSRPVP